MSADTTRGSESGFTLVEILVAAMVLVIGILGALGLFSSALRNTASTNERVGATNLARELVEAARGVDYSRLDNANVVAAVQALPNMGSGNPWTITRRGVKYTVTAEACVYDDPTDGSDNTRTDRCPGNPVSATPDRSGDDFRRVTFTVKWKDHRGSTATGTMKQTTMVVNPSGGLGPRIISITPDVPVITDPSATQAKFSVETTSADLLNWTSDDGRSGGQYQGPAKTWKIVWNIGTFGTAGYTVDGTYKISAQATDQHGIAGDRKLAVVQINRTAPLALALQGGYNSRLGVVELMWDPTVERDIIGYRAYYAGPDNARGGGNDVLACPSTAGGWMGLDTLSCAYPHTLSSSESYYVVALDNQGAREGAASNVIKATSNNNPPNAPQALTPSRPNGIPQLDWSAPQGPAPKLYRIYRGGTGLANRIGYVDGTVTSFTDGSAGAGGQYWVTAVDSNFNESAPVGPVTP